MVAATDVKVYKTTNNLGGAITGTQIVSSTSNNLFVNVPKNELVVGEDYYACVYIKNGHATESMDNFTLWLTNKSFPSNTTIKWAFDPVSTSTGYKWEPYFTADGSTTFDSTADDPAYDLTTFSVSAWFKTSVSLGSRGYIVNKGGEGSDTAGQNDNYSIAMNTNGTIRAGFEEGSGTDHYATSPLAYNDGEWHLVFMSYGGSTVKLYVDDMTTEVATHSTSTTPETNAQPVVIGRNSRSSANFFNGLIDEVNIWSGVKSDESRQALLQNIVSPTNLKLQKKFGADTNVLVAQTIADKYTAPLGVTWNEVSSAPSTPNYGNLAAGKSFPIWLWYHVPANAVEILDDSETFAFRFDIPQGGTGTGGGSDCAEGTYHYEPYETFTTGADMITVTEPTAPDLSPPFSLSCWFRTTADYNTNIVGYMVVKGLFTTETPGSNINFALLISTDIDPPNHAVEIFFEDSTGLGWGAGAGTGLGNGPAVEVNDGLWHNLVGTYDGTDLKVYLDSFLDFTNETGGAVPDINNQSMYIGAHGPSGSTPFMGDLDEIKIWNVALTQQEISDLYNNGDIPQSGSIVYENTFGGSGAECGGSGGSGGSPPPANTDYKIAVAGDWGCEPETDDVIDLIQSEGYDHVVGVGDNAYESASCWTNRFTPLKSIMNSAYGNHEYSESGGVGPYKTFFGHSLTYFTYKFENIQFFVFDTNINIDNGSTQHTFFENALAASQNDNTVTWRIAIGHHPWFGASSDHGYNEFDQVEALHELFQNNGVRIVCTGHNHNWQRTHMVAFNEDSPTSPTVVDNTSPYSRSTVGLIHVVTGTGGHDSGGSLYSLGSQPSYQAYQNRTHNGVWEIVASNNAQTLTCSFVSVDGDRFDTFTITA